MNRYLVLLRGINVGGKNMVNMSRLAKSLESAGFNSVRTYINSGNIFLSSEFENKEAVAVVCESVITAEFGLNIAALVMARDEYMEAIDSAPEWWGLGQRKDDILVCQTRENAREIYETARQIDMDSEKMGVEGRIVFWSVSEQVYDRARLGKLLGKKANGSVTVRNANTAKAIYKLLGEE